MSHDVDIQTVEPGRDAGQALGLMGLSLVMVTWAGPEASATVLSVVGFSILLMTLIAGSLFLFEARFDETKRGSISGFCLPAVGLLGFSLALLFAAGFWSLAVVVCVVAFAFAACRRVHLDGPFNLVPSAAFDLGLVGGVGASLGGVLVVGAGLFMA